MKKILTILFSLAVTVAYAQQPKVAQSLYYQPNAYKLTDEHKEQLEELIPKLQKRAIVLQGFTDEVGSQAENEELSKLRVHGLRDYLLENGLLIEYMQVDYFGESQLVDGDRSLNRRVLLRTGRLNDSNFQGGVGNPEGLLFSYDYEELNPKIAKELKNTELYQGIDQMRSQNLTTQTVDGGLLSSAGVFELPPNVPCDIGTPLTIYSPVPADFALDPNDIQLFDLTQDENGTNVWEDSEMTPRLDTINGQVYVATTSDNFCDEGGNTKIINCDIRMIAPVVQLEIQGIQPLEIEIVNPDLNAIIQPVSFHKDKNIYRFRMSDPELRDSEQGIATIERLAEKLKGAEDAETGVSYLNFKAAIGKDTLWVRNLKLRDILIEGARRNSFDLEDSTSFLVNVSPSQFYMNKAKGQKLRALQKIKSKPNSKWPTGLRWASNSTLKDEQIQELLLVNYPRCEANIAMIYQDEQTSFNTQQPFKEFDFDRKQNNYQLPFFNPKVSAKGAKFEFKVSQFDESDKKVLTNQPKAINDTIFELSLLTFEKLNTDASIQISYETPQGTIQLKPLTLGELPQNKETGQYELEVIEFRLWAKIGGTKIKTIKLKQFKVGVVQEMSLDADGIYTGYGLKSQLKRTSVSLKLEKGKRKFSKTISFSKLSKKGEVYWLKGKHLR